MTQEELKQALYYDANLGLFYWRSNRRGRGAPKAGDVAGNFVKHYWYISLGKKRYLAHRLIWFYVHGRWPKHEIDHIDGNGANNKLSNLREATRAQNCHNVKKGGTSGVQGVHWIERDKRWQARIQVGYKRHHLGYFKTLAEASGAARRARAKHHGEFSSDARLED